MALRLYLSGAPALDGNSSPSQSLGKYPSQIEIQNAVLNNLFPDISRFSVQQNKPEVRAIVIHNDGATELTNLRAFFTYPQDDNSEDSNDAEYLIQYVDLEADSCGDPAFPYSVSNPNASPYNVDFEENAIGDENALQLPNLPADGMLGIWIKRVLKTSALSPLSNEDLCAITEGTLVLDTLEEIELTFSWD